MACMLRISGRNFDAKHAAEKTSLAIVKVHIKGEPVLSTKPERGKKRESSINIQVSRTQFHQLARQIRDAKIFLQRNAREVRRLSRLPGVQYLTLDFGIARRDVAAQFDRFPPELLLAYGRLGLSLEVSWYQAFDEPAG